MAKTNTRYQWLTIAYTLTGLLFYWWKIIKDAHLYLFGVEEQGIKSYFATLYYILYDKNQHFTGLNYPYGDHIVYTDGQPVLSLLLSPLMNGNFEYAGNIITILNLFMFLSIPVAAIYLFKLFSLWKMPNIYSSVFAAMISLLSPQVLRMTDHIALSYVCFFPMIWFYAAQWLQERKLSSIILFSVTLTFFAFIHIYYLGIGIAFIVCTVFFYILYKIKIRQSWTKALILLVAALLPLVIYSIWLDASGARIISDRPVQPYGFFDNTASLRDVFIPIEGVFKELVSLFIPIKDHSREGYAYVGLAAILSTLAGVWVLRDRILEKEFLASSLGVFLLASFVCLLVAFGLPFRFIPASWIPHEIMQFRTLGRFAWPFYFVFAATSAWLLYILAEYLRKKSHMVIATVIIVGMALLWTFEGLALQKRQAGYIKENGKLANDFLSFENSYKRLLTDIGLSPEYYQAILTFPYFNVGSERFNIDRNHQSLYYAAKIALDTRIPIAQNYLNRTSLAQSIRTVQLLSNPLIEKDVLKDLQDDRSFLLVTTGNQFEPDELRIIEQSRKLITKGNITLYDLPLSAFNQIKPDIDLLKKSFKTRVIDEVEASSSSYSNFLWKNFYGISTKGKNHLLANYVIPRSSKKENIEVSLWIKVSSKRSDFPLLFVDVLNDQKKVIKSFPADPRHFTDVKNEHVRVKIVVPYAEQNHTLRVRLKGSNQSLSTFMIKPLQQSIWIKDKAGNEYLDNYPLGDLIKTL